MRGTLDEKIRTAIEYLDDLPAAADSAGHAPPKPGTGLPPCTAPSVRERPRFSLFFERIVPLRGAASSGQTESPPQPVAPEQPLVPRSAPAGGATTSAGSGASGEETLACAGFLPQLSLSALLRFEQSWTLDELCIGDLASTMGLAPSEQVTLEILTSQRRLVDQDTVDSREQQNTTENTTAEKEVVNVAHTSSKTEKWGVNGNGSFSLGGILKLGVGDNYGRTLQDTSQSSSQHIHDTTSKSTETLKTLHKVEVRNVSESLVQNRTVRTFRNPYPDRTLAINVFELQKRFSVSTGLAEVRAALTLDVGAVRFDETFVVNNADFVRANLIDQALIDQLPTALQGAGPGPTDDTTKRARRAARLALETLFDRPNIFNLPRTTNGDTNDPHRPFDAQATDLGKTGFGDSMGRWVIFTSLNVFFRLYETIKPLPTFDEDVVALALALTADIKPKWDMITAPQDGDFDKIVGAQIDNDSLTEPYRRLTGFLALVTGTVQPLADAASQDQAAAQQYQAAQATLARLVEHLRCHGAYYTEAFLRYVAAQGSGQLVDLLRRVLHHLDGAHGDLAERASAAFDLSRLYVDGRTIVVPGSRALADDEVNGLVAALGSRHGQAFDRRRLATPSASLSVPADGVHLEVAAGGCVLALPASD